MRLLVKTIDGEDLNFVMTKSSCVIGRSNQCDFQISHEAMSRKHCLLEIKEGKFYVTDLASSNGIYIDDKRIRPDVEVEFPVYLSLAFGAVQNLQIELEDKTLQNFKLESKNDFQAPGSDQSVTKKFKKEVTRPNFLGEELNATPIKSKKTSQKSIFYLIIAFICLILVAFVIYQKHMQKELPLTPEEMYE